MTRQEVAIEIAGTENLQKLNEMWANATKKLTSLQLCRDSNVESVMLRAVKVRDSVHGIGFAIKILEGGKIRPGDFWSDMYISIIRKIDPKNTAGTYE